MKEGEKVKHENNISNNVNEEDEEEEKSNTKKLEENEAVKVEHDYKNIKDFTTDYRIYENNIFFNEKSDQFRKY